MDSPKKKRQKIEQSAGANDETKSSSVATNLDIDTLPEAVFHLILEFLICHYDMVALPTHLRYRDLPPTHAWRQSVASKRSNASFQTYCKLSTVSKQWKTLTEQYARNIRLARVQLFCSDSAFENFELIYQPHGLDMPERIAAKMRTDNKEPIPGALLPREGLLFMRIHTRNNACLNRHYDRQSRLRRMMDDEVFDANIPPHKFQGINEVVHIVNTFEDEPPVFVGEPSDINRRGFCVRRPGGRWTTMDGTEELSDSEVKQHFNRNDGMLSLATRQGEDLCANFLREHFAAWTNEA